LFKNIYSDAFDGDFVNGQITHSKFISCRNDGIDISGSDVTLEHIVVGDCGDKGISAGERSILRGNNIAIKNTEIGIASKDNSEVRFENVSTVNVKVDATAFKKKSEYGSSTISVHGYKSLDSSEKFIIEIGSQLNVNSNIVSGEEQNVEAMLYGNIYGRSSK